MTPTRKRALKFLILFPIAAVSLWIGISNIAMLSLDRSGIKRYSYEYWVSIPVLIRNVPEVGIVGESKFSEHAIDNGPGWQEIHYRSAEQPAVIEQRIAEYLISRDFAPCQTKECMHGSSNQVWASDDPEEEGHWVEIFIGAHEDRCETDNAIPKDGCQQVSVSYYNY